MPCAAARRSCRASSFRAKTFISDQIKTLLLSLILGTPLLALIFYLVPRLGDHWWLAAWGLLALVSPLSSVAPLWIFGGVLAGGLLAKKVGNLTSRPA